MLGIYIAMKMHFQQGQASSHGVYTRPLAPGMVGETRMFAAPSNGRGILRAALKGDGIRDFTLEAETVGDKERPWHFPIGKSLGGSGRDFVRGKLHVLEPAYYIRLETRCKEYYAQFLGVSLNLFPIPQ